MPKGQFTPTPVTFTRDGVTVTWKGRGRMPAEVVAMVEAGTYVPPHKARRDAARAAKAKAKAEKVVDTAAASTTVSE